MSRRKSLLKTGSIVCLGISWLWVVSCGDGKKLNWVKSPLSGHLHFANSHSTEDTMEIYTDRQTVLVWNKKSAASPKKADFLTDNQGLHVVASIPSLSPLAYQLAADPATLAFYEADSGLSYALLKLENVDELNWLAAAVHTDAHISSDTNSIPRLACGGVTVLNFTALTEATDAPIAPAFSEVAALDGVQKLLRQVSTEKIKTTVASLEARGTRHHTTESGLKTPQAIKELLQSAAADWNALEYKFVDHKSYTTGTQATQQNSLVVSLPGTSDDQTAIVIGAHLDSINSHGVSEPAPGADDDASGVATLVEVVRVLAANNVRFKRRIEFQFYAAEEVGLIGSRHIAQTYRSQKRQIAAMLQMDMNAFSPADGDKTIHLVIEDTDFGLRRSTKDLLNAYLEGHFTEEHLSGGTSDHRSWSEQGFRAVFPFESPSKYNKSLHTANDTSSTINNFELSNRFASLAISFLAHHAGITSSTSASSYEEAYKQTLSNWRANTTRDIKLSVVASSTSGQYVVSAAASSKAEKIEVCAISTAGGLGCSGERMALDEERSDGGRRIYSLSEPIALAADSRLALFAYDDQDKLIEQRSIRLDQP